MSTALDTDDATVLAHRFVNQPTAKVCAQCASTEDDWAMRSLLAGTVLPCTPLDEDSWRKPGIQFPTSAFTSNV